MANIGGSELLTPTPGATVTVTITGDVTRTVAKWSSGENETVNISGTQKAGQQLFLIITNDAVVRTITLGTGFVSAGIIVGTALKAAAVQFVSDGTSFYEVGRALILA